METIKEQYLRSRSSIPTGSVILYVGNSIVSKIIQNCDNAEFTHVEIAAWNRMDRLEVYGANLTGIDPTYFSNSLKHRKRFIVIIPQRTPYEILKALKDTFNKNNEDEVKYDFKNGIKELINRKLSQFKLPPMFNLSLNENEKYCSLLVVPYLKELGIMKDSFFDIKAPFPQDIIRHINYDKIKIIC